jgi:hypothetical protein
MHSEKGPATKPERDAVVQVQNVAKEGKNLCCFCAITVINARKCTSDRLRVTQNAPLNNRDDNNCIARSCRSFLENLLDGRVHRNEPFRSLDFVLSTSN